ncbi:MAG: restriction endonuclease [Phycisphaerae bacterium]|nr:restriction endonuclease [Phycisphaerae bacterium]
MTLYSLAQAEWAGPCFLFVILAAAVYFVGAWVVGRIAEASRVKAQARLDVIQAERRKIEGEKNRLLEMAKEIEVGRLTVEQQIRDKRDALATQNSRDRQAILALAEEQKKQNDQDKQTVLTLAKEKSQGFPWLAEAYSEYFLLQQLKEAEALETKKHPAVRSAERIREIARDRRVVEQKLRVVQGIIAYWLELFPFLEDWLGDDVDEELLRRLLSKNIEVPFKDVPDFGEDPVRIMLNRLSDDEYRKLSTSDRNQRALDAWRARPKTKWQIGREYERYIGYLCENRGYNVYYQGILEGYDDLGRDLVARKSDETLIIQCKCWSRHKRIHEKHVNQLFGTSVEYMLDHPEDRLFPVFYTSTELTDRARRFATHVRVQVQEGFPLKEHPCIKCNISRATGERIYHLPFDQQYDTTQIEPNRGECYVETVAEAEALGFRRAWRWHGEDANAE